MDQVITLFVGSFVVSPLISVLYVFTVTINKGQNDTKKKHYNKITAALEQPFAQSKRTLA